jgi:tripartite-type tricarboxylate transporter receptor subunit TctC
MSSDTRRLLWFKFEIMAVRVVSGVIGVIAAASTGSATDQVLRLFNKALGQHLYTTSSAEASGLIAGGWTSETALGYV